MPVDAIGAAKGTDGLRHRSLRLSISSCGTHPNLRTITRYRLLVTHRRR